MHAFAPAPPHTHTARSGPSNVSLSRLDIEDFADHAVRQAQPEGSGGLLDFYAALELVECALSNNRATSLGGGGAVYVESALLSVRGGSMTDNSGPSGGAIYAVDSHVLLRNTFFTDNAAPGGLGGAVRVEHGKLHVAGTLFAGNAARYGGGLSARCDEISISGCARCGRVPAPAPRAREPCGPGRRQTIPHPSNAHRLPCWRRRRASLRCSVFI